MYFLYWVMGGFVLFLVCFMAKSFVSIAFDEGPTEWRFLLRFRLDTSWIGSTLKLYSFLIKGLIVISGLGVSSIFGSSGVSSLIGHSSGCNPKYQSEYYLISFLISVLWSIKVLRNICYFSAWSCSYFHLSSPHCPIMMFEDRSFSPKNLFHYTIALYFIISRLKRYCYLVIKNSIVL